MMANVAQLVEPRFVVPVVVGSSPIVRPRLKKHLLKGAFFVRTPVCLEIKKQRYLEITLFFL